MLLMNLHLASCLFLTGLIWTVQMVHYPSFAFVAEAQFEKFNIFHQSAITYVVGPMMVFELLTGVMLWINQSQDWKFLALVSMVGLIWLSTFFLSVPLHTKLLNNGYNKEVIDQLVLTNWPRTILWSLRSVLLLYLLKGFNG